MKKGSYWLCYLTEEEKERFIDNFSASWDFNLAYFDSLYEFIASSFVWYETPEGHDYWHKISFREEIPGFKISKYVLNHEFY